MERRSILKRYTDNPQVIDELLAYNENTFDFAQVDAGLTVPLPSEGHLADWRRYAADVECEGIESVLRRIFPALLFPIKEGMSLDPALKATRTRGVLPKDRSGGSRFYAPEQIEFFIHPSLAGEIPVLLLPDRRDFELLVRVILKKNEPAPIPSSMGASMIAGYNNWDRVHQLRRRWEAESESRDDDEDWGLHFSNVVVPDKAAYQDRFVLLSRGPYSDVPASVLGLDNEEWLDLSTTIRLEHECTHYLTKRALGFMRNNIFDELLADYAGIVAACGEFRSDWFLHFVGLEDEKKYRVGGRLENYIGDPPLSEEAFGVLCDLCRRAASNLTSKDFRHLPSSFQGRADQIFRLARGTVTQLGEPIPTFLDRA